MAEKVVGGLKWVRGEIAVALRRVRDLVETYGASGDPAGLKEAVDALLEVRGVLLALQLNLPARLAEEMQRLADAMFNASVHSPKASAETMMLALILLPDYLDRLDAGTAPPPRSLWTAINKLRESRSVPPLSQDELLVPELMVTEDSGDAPPPEALDALGSDIRKVRPLFHRHLVEWHREGAGANALVKLGGIFRQLHRHLTDGILADLFRLAEAYADGLQGKQQAPSPAAQTLVGHLDRVLKPLTQIPPAWPAAEASALIDEFLTALMSVGVETPAVAELQAKYGQGSASTVPPSQPSEALAGLARAVLVELETVKERLDRFARGVRDDLAPLEETRATLGRLAQTLDVTSTGRLPARLRELADGFLELASSDTGENALRAELLAAELLRIEAELQAYAEQRRPAEVSGIAHGLLARELSTATLREAQVELAQVKDAIQACQTPGERPSVFAQVPDRLASISGALQILGNDPAAHLSADIAALVQRHYLGPARWPIEPELSPLADAIAALELYIERLAEGESQSTALITRAGESLSALDSMLRESSPTLPGPALRGEPADTDRASSEPAPEIGPDVPPPAAEGPGLDSAGISPEFLDIFLEEAEEETRSVAEQFARWQTDPSDESALTTLRRSFHTLKGSGRLVGAERVGQLAQSVEAALNQVIDHSLTPGRELIALVADAAGLLPDLVAAEAEGRPLAVDDLVGRFNRLTSAGGSESSPPIEKADAAAPPAAEIVIPPGGDRPVETTQRTTEPIDEIVLESREDWTLAPLDEAVKEKRLAREGTDLEQAVVPETPIVTDRASLFAEDDELLDIFRAETREHLDTLHAFLARVADGDRVPDESLVRALHTLTGSARMSGVGSIAVVSKPLELRLRHHLTEGSPAPEELIDLIQGAAKGIELRITEIPATGPGAEALADLALALTVPGAGPAEPETRARTTAPFVPPRDWTDLTELRLPAIESTPRIGDGGIQAQGGDHATGVLAEEGLSPATEDGGGSDDLLDTDFPSLGAGRSDDEPTEASKPPSVRDSEPGAPEDEQALLPEAFPAPPGADSAQSGDSEHPGLQQAEPTASEFEPGPETLTKTPLEAETRQEHEPEREAEPETPADLGGEPGVQVVTELADRPEASTAMEPKARSEIEPAPAAEPGTEQADETESTDELEYPPDDPELKTLFMEDARDLLDGIDARIREWQLAPQELGVLDGINRLLHTLKGSARLAGLTTIGDLSHALETRLTAVAGAQGGVDDTTLELTQKAVDTLSIQVDALEQGAPLPRAQSLVEALNQPPEKAPLVAPGEPDLVVMRPAAAPRTGGAEAAPAPFSATSAEREGATAVRGVPQIRVRSDLLDRLVDHSGEISLYRARLAQRNGLLGFGLGELDQTVARLREQLRLLEIETEAHILHRVGREGLLSEDGAIFDPLELDRFSTLQQLSRALAETVNDLVSLKDLLGGYQRESADLLTQQARIADDLQDGLLRTRMVPFVQLVPRLHRLVRQTADNLGKSARLEVIGPEVELDRSILDRLAAPLEHLLRNAVDHGLEDPQDRARAGKPAVGVVTLALSRDGNDVVLDLSDDGRGLDLAAIRSKAVARGLLAPQATLPDATLMQFVFEPGFTTSGRVTQISGRGVGLDVVASEIKAANGSIALESTAGQGTRFVMRLPLTLAIIDAFLVSAGDNIYAVPHTTIEGAARIGRDELAAVYRGKGRDFDYRGNSYRLAYLGGVLDPRQKPELGERRWLPLLLTRVGDLRVALQVDSLIESGRIVVKPLGPQLAGIRWLSGGTILPDGRVALILDALALLRSGAIQDYQSADALNAAAAPTPICVMVVDDSLTVRRVTSRLLRRQNMEVLTAKDGVEALTLLDERRPDVLLLDIEMPRMDGYELTRHVRRSARLKDLPIIMITSRTGDKHREHARSLGVNRYLGKPYQESELLSEISSLLKENGR